LLPWSREATRGEFQNLTNLRARDVELFHDLVYRHPSIKIFEDESHGQTRIAEDPSPMDSVRNAFYSWAL
jgi:hypothetical protein